MTSVWFNKIPKIYLCEEKKTTGRDFLAKIPLRIRATASCKQTKMFWHQLISWVISVNQSFMSIVSLLYEIISNTQKTTFVWNLISISATSWTIFKFYGWVIWITTFLLMHFSWFTELIFILSQHTLGIILCVSVHLYNVRVKQQCGGRMDKTFGLNTWRSEVLISGRGRCSLMVHMHWASDAEVRDQM